MELKDWIPIAISVTALLGTGYSLYLYRKQEARDKERFKWETAAEQREVEKTIKRLELYVDFPGGIPGLSEKASLVILNAGQRPVTVADVLADIYRNNDPRNVYGRSAMIINKSVRDEHFPHLLGESESMEIPLGISRQYLKDEGIGLRVDVTDADGDIYEEITFREHDSIHGFYRTIDKESI